MTFSKMVSERAAALALLACATAGAQTLVFSTTTDLPATPYTVYEEELHGYDAAGRFPVLTREVLGLATGDANGNGIFDDQPLDIDAAHESGLPEPGSFFLSVTSDFAMPDGTQVKDGDVFHFTGTGVLIDLNEAFFEAATGTSAIDVDAFALAPNGDVYFSFAEDETTTSGSLIAQNGGSATLDEQCVFKLVPGGPVATIHLTPAAVLALFNHAFGTTASTVVDVDGVEMDPANPGEVLLTCLSTSAAFRGKVITSAGAGTPFSIGGQQIGPTALGLPSTTSLDALAIVTGPRFPTLRTVPEVVSAAAPGTARVESSGWVAGAPVQFVVTDAVLPQPAFLGYASQAGYNASPLDPANALFYSSFSISAWLVPANANGIAEIQFATAGIPAGINAIIQTVDLVTGTMSTPAAMAFVP